MSRKLLLLCMPAVLATTGCADLSSLTSYFDMTKNIPWGAGVDGEQKAPMKVAAMWTDTVLNVSNQPSKRGFGGRLMFYAAEGGKPIKVKGTLSVYAFDETNHDTDKVRPDKKFVFTTEQFEKHYSKSALGHSYSVWLPWDDAGGPRRDISLLVRFTPEGGPAVIGEASKQILPGPAESDPTQYSSAAGAPRGGEGVSPLAAVMAAGAAGAVQPAAYDAPLPGATLNAGAPGMLPQANPTGMTTPQRRMSTTTINVPSSSGVRKPTTLGGPQASDGALNGNAPNVNYVSPATAATTGSATTAAPTNSTASSAAAATEGLNSAATTAAPSAHFGPQRRRPLGEPLARLNRDHVPWQPSR